MSKNLRRAAKDMQRAVRRSQFRCGGGEAFPSQTNEARRKQFEPVALDSLVPFGVAAEFPAPSCEGLNVIYHFTFKGREQQRAKITISNQTLTITDEHVGKPDLQVTADSDALLGFTAKERNLVWALLRRKNSHQRVAAIIAGFRPMLPILDRWPRGTCFNHGVRTFAVKRARSLDFSIPVQYFLQY